MPPACGRARGGSVCGHLGCAGSTGRTDVAQGPLALDARTWQKDRWHLTHGLGTWAVGTGRTGRGQERKFQKMHQNLYHPHLKFRLLCPDPKQNHLKKKNFNLHIFSLVLRNLSSKIMETPRITLNKRDDQFPSLLIVTSRLPEAGPAYIWQLSRT